VKQQVIGHDAAGRTIGSIPQKTKISAKSSRAMSNSPAQTVGGPPRDMAGGGGQEVKLSYYGPFPQN